MLRAATLYFALVFGAGFALGAVRVPFLVPQLGERVAELVEMPIMCAVIYVSARHLTRRFRSRVAGSAWLLVGLAALLLIVAAELTLAVVLQERSLSDYIASRDPVSGSVYLAMLVLYAAAPWLHARRRRAGRLE